MEKEKPQTRKTTEASYSHVLRYTGVFGGVQGLKTMVAMVRNKLTTYILGSAGFGLISVYNSISEFIVSCSNFGLPLNATRETSELYVEGTPESIRRMVCIIRTWAVWTSALAALICVLLSPLLSYHFFDEDFGHFTDIILLIPIIVSLLVSEAECSILKGCRHLKRVAAIESVTAVTTLLFTIPFYILWGMHGVLVGLIVSSLVSAVVHLWFSVQVVPYRIEPFSRKVFVEGWPIMRRGVPYVISGIANAGAGIIIIALIKRQGLLEDVGLYRAGVAIMVTYAGFAFTALESDYYPRLSSVNHDVVRINRTINQQIHVSVMLITPFLILLLLCMPWVIRLLYQPEFLAILGMTLCASYYVFLRAVMLPIAYTSLAKGDSVVYLVMEVLSDTVLVVSMCYLYPRLGLPGAGMALSINALYDLLSAALVYGWRYHCRIALPTWRIVAFHFVCLTTSVAAALVASAWLKVAVMGGCFLVSGLHSLRVLHEKTRKPE